MTTSQRASHQGNRLPHGSFARAEVTGLSFASDAVQAHIAFIAMQTTETAIYSVWTENSVDPQMRLKPLVLTILFFAIIAGAAYGLRASGWWSGPQVAAPAATPAAKPQAAAGQGGGGGRPPAPVEVAEARAETLTDSISAVGSLVALESAEVAAESAGRILTVSAKDGVAVKKGDALFSLDGALLAAELQDTEARLALAETTFRRAQTLARSQNVAQSQVDQSRAELEQARSAVALVRERQRRLVVRAPFDGTLGFRLVSEGAYVTAGTPLVRIDQIASLKVSLSIPERYYAALSLGQEVNLTAEAVPGKTFRARITAINPVVDVNGRALQILATLDNTDLQLRPGMLVRAEVLGTPRAAVTVLESAVVPQGRDLIAFQVDGDKVKRLVVTTGVRRDGRVEVTSGLPAGVQVVTAGGTRLSDGATVKISKSAASQ